VEARNLRIVQTFSTITLEGDVCITEDVVDEIVHSRFLEPASITSLAAKSCGSTDLFSQEVADIFDEPLRGVQFEVQDDLTNTAFFTTEELIRNALAHYVFTCIDCRVGVVSWLGF